ncbi:MAG: hypothetical protein FJZ79_02145 [Chlorobi bacterium]|nr:hypothetical protein [Chlorobiota bacterium]
MSLSGQQVTKFLEKDSFYKNAVLKNSQVYPYTEIIVKNLELLNVASVDVMVRKISNSADLHKSVMPGFIISGTHTASDADKGEIVLNLHRGDRLLYRSGSCGNSCRVIVVSREKQFLQELPTSSEWTCLEFSNRLLPDKFKLRFLDEGGATGQWIAIALKRKY